MRSTERSVYRFNEDPACSNSAQNRTEPIIRITAAKMRSRACGSSLVIAVQPPETISATPDKPRPQPPTPGVCPNHQPAPPTQQPKGYTHHPHGRPVAADTKGSPAG